MQLSAGETRFVEGMGLYFERQGVPRIGGKLFGLLMLSEGPLALDDLARLLKVSRASVSTNMRQFITAGVCEPASVPGDRRHYYGFREDAWERHLTSSMASIQTVTALCRAGVDAVGQKKPRSRTRLRKTVEFFEFFGQEIEASLARWKKRVRRA